MTSSISRSRRSSPRRRPRPVLADKGAVAFSWVGVRLRDGSAGVAPFELSVSRLASEVGNGYTFAIRQLDLVHQQVQEAIRPQAFAIAAFGAFALLALFVLVGQALSQLLEDLIPQVGALRTMGLRKRDVAMAFGLGGAETVAVGVLFAIGCAAGLSPLGPVGPVRAIDPALGFQFDATVLVGGGAVMLVLLLALTAWISGRAVRAVDGNLVPRLAGCREGGRLARVACYRSARCELRPRYRARTEPPDGPGECPGRGGGSDGRRNGCGFRSEPERACHPPLALRMELERAAAEPRGIRELPCQQRQQGHDW